ncbi:unnamed protein product [Bursaphelenchus xylophilus]|uniref:(pine wood nematode) hypothetical protein n=1 Tax=Bursaphelenchus xylophilus TaxID=6326 RepID=A0A1I7SD01_BURXY|nr:unnamed protein product [Bursaphelenchus xylophilus]CAG9093169.1 unnamed protein product [Bursaphelenchus xylophilus]
MAAQTTTIETVSVVRPMKVIALICLILSLILLIIALSTKSWVSSDRFHTGLFEECTAESNNGRPANIVPVPDAPAEGTCQSITRANLVYVKAVAGLLIVAALATFIGLLANLLGLKTNDLHKKHTFYKGATYAALFSVLCQLTALIVYPVCFFFTMNTYGIRNWAFDWSYGVAFGAMLITFGASLMLICDKEHDEIYYKEKTIYNPPDNFA